MTAAERNAGRITTFYSYKGGTGRTMMLANCAWQLAEAGRHALVVDWDLEAPGLHRYFAPFLGDPELARTDGLMDLVIAYASAAVDPGRENDSDGRWIDEHADVLRYAVSLNWTFPSGGSITLMPAGRQGPNYATGVNTFSWKHFYEKLGGFGFLERVREQMRSHFDEVLIDSRTGVSDTAGISTVQMPHQLVVCFTLNNQSIVGAAGVAQSARDGHGALLPSRPSESDTLRVFPVPMRIEPSESERLRQRWLLAQQRFDPLLDHLPAQRRGEPYWTAVQVPYIPLVAYEEVLAAVANQPGDPKSTNMLVCVQSVAQEVFGITPQAPSLDAEQRRALLQAFASGVPLQDLPPAQPSTQALDTETRLRAEVAALRRQAEPPRRTGGFGRRPHAFVAMPFGRKAGPDGYPIDFDRIYADLFVPALEAAGFEAFRADQEMQAGDIRTDMFQELLMADLVLVDVTLDNPNVWYELGVRHALRARGVVLTLGPRATQPFDIYSDRKLRYTLKDGLPDTDNLESDRQRLMTMLGETASASAQRIVSPVYALLPHLREPLWRELLMEGKNPFADAQREWNARVDVARRRGRAGDILVLADETPTRALRLEGKLAAGNSLLALDQPALALEQFDEALTIDVTHHLARSRRVVALTQLGRYEEAVVEAGRLTAEVPAQAEYWGLAGRVAKDRWVRAWRHDDLSPEQWRVEAAYADHLLDDAIALYRQGFAADPASYYAAFNAVLLLTLKGHLGATDPKAELQVIDGGLRWACALALARDPRAYWVLVTQAEQALLSGTDSSPLLAAYRRAIDAAQGDRFALQSSLRTIDLLSDLNFRPDALSQIRLLFERAMAKGNAAPAEVAPRHVLVFSGHMMDSPTRSTPRFPPSRRAAAERAIARVLDEWQVGPADIAITQGAAGGDLLFAHACQQRGVRLRLMLPLAEAAFVEASVLPSAQGSDWQQSFFDVKSRLAEPPLEMPTELGPAPDGVAAFERCNLWILNTALSLGPDKLRLICLWDGGGGDGLGGTEHMVQEAKRRTGHVYWIDVRTLAEEGNAHELT